jgi:hypothetical protein
LFSLGLVFIVYKHLDIYSILISLGAIWATTITVIIVYLFRMALKALKHQEGKVSGLDSTKLVKIETHTTTMVSRGDDHLF